jgi:lysozyme
MNMKTSEKGISLIEEFLGSKLQKTALDRSEATLNKLGLNLTQNQFDALVSYSHNVGISSFLNSSLLKMIQLNPTSTDIRGEFLKRVKAGGQVLPELVRRREAEATLYFDNDGKTK